MADERYLGQGFEEEPSKLQRVMKSLSERMMRAAAGGGNQAAYRMLPEYQAMQEREMGLKTRGLDIQEENMRLNNELKRLMFDKKAKLPILTKGQEAADIAFAKDYADYNAKGGFASIQKQLGQLEDVAKQLDKGEINTSPMSGISVASGTIGSFLDPKLLAAKQSVEQAVQQTLRQTLGAQFTQKEGEMLLARSFDPKLPPKENAKKLRNTINELKQMAQAKEKAGKYYEQYGTIAGFKGTGNRGTSLSQALPQQQEKIVVSNGRETLRIDASDLADAQKEGFQVVQNGMAR